LPETLREISGQHNVIGTVVPHSSADHHLNGYQQLAQLAVLAECRSPGQPRTMIRSILNAFRNRRPRRSDMSLKSRLHSAVEIPLLAPAFALSWTVGPPAREAGLGLLNAFGNSDPQIWADGSALGASLFIGLFLMSTLMLGAGLRTMVSVVFRRERLRAAYANELYAGPGLRGQPRLDG